MWGGDGLNDRCGGPFLEGDLQPLLATVNVITAALISRENALGYSMLAPACGRLALRLGCRTGRRSRFWDCLRANHGCNRGLSLTDLSGTRPPGSGGAKERDTCSHT